MDNFFGYIGAKPAEDLLALSFILQDFSRFREGPVYLPEAIQDGHFNRVFLHNLAHCNLDLGINYLENTTNTTNVKYYKYFNTHPHRSPLSREDQGAGSCRESVKGQGLLRVLPCREKVRVQAPELAMTKKV